MAQTSYDYFMQPFRLFGIELRREAKTANLNVKELASGRYLDFHFNEGTFSFFATETAPDLGKSRTGVGLSGVITQRKNETELLLHVRRSFPKILATSWRELADAYEPQLEELGKLPDDDMIEMSEAEFMANSAVMLAFLRTLESERTSVEGRYELAGEPFQATREEIRQSFITN